jgi:Protein of unknown function (DUF3826)
MRTAVITAVFIFVPLSVFAGQRVDLNQDNGRGDVLSPGWDNWRIPEKDAATAKFGDITMSLRAVGPNARLATGWWKPGFDYPARMASDGVSAAGKLELTLGGLSAGKHSLATFHNTFTDAKPARITVAIAGGGSVTVTPTSRVKHDADAATAFVEFDAVGGKVVVVTFTPESGSVILNGFEIDRSDPAKRAAKPSSGEVDEHISEDPVLAWRAAPGATSHRVYVGADPNLLTLRGETKEPTFPTVTLKLNTRDMYYWRVDTLHGEKVIPGEVWRFRVRHLAFPEAEGYGRFAIGGRGGEVYEVTNLNDAGPGSLREAVEASGPRTVVFRVGGVIALKGKLIVRNPYLTVAGQTAPGDGICIANYTFGCSDTHDVIIRHVRIRIGDESGETQDGSGARGSDHIIYDHCSISWSIDEGFSSREAKNLTVQYCLIAEALNIANHRKYKEGKGHSFAASISGGIGSFHHNLLAHCTGRNWSLAGGLDRTGQTLGGRLDIRNNVVYNWRDRTTDGGVRELNFVSNLYLPGPATKTFTLLKPDPGDPERGMRAHMNGNAIEGKAEFDADNWKAYVGPAAGMAKVKFEQTLFEPFVKTHATKELLAIVLADAGATRPKRDAVDTRIIADVRKRVHTFTGSKGKLPGIIDSPTDAGGLPEYKSGEAPLDTDHDGIPDEWEKAHGLDPKNPADGSAFRRDGYTNLEAWLYELATPSLSKRPSADPKYLESIEKRATAALVAANVQDEAKKLAAIKVVEAHYVGINDIHFDRDAAVKAAAVDNDAVNKVHEKAEVDVAVVHKKFTHDLAALLTPEQCDAVKDKMTYDVRLLTFKVYCEMLPKLTEQETAMIREMLRAGREAALVAGDADEKHAKFRIAKGKIANFLSKQGYDLKKAEAEWNARRKTDPTKKNNE